MAKYILKTKHINSKLLGDEIIEFIDRIITDFNIIWRSDSQRDTVLEVIDEYMEDLVNVKKIEQWNVVCDGRNNKKVDIKNKTTNLDIEYRQYNCYNVTSLNYTITK